MSTAALSICILIVLLAVLMAALWFSRIRFELCAFRLKDNDRFSVNVRALFGLFRYRMNIPMIDFRNWSDGVVVKHKTDTNAIPAANGTDETHINREWIMQFYERLRLLVKNVFDLLEWTREAVARVECTHLAWHTRVGVGDAPETAVVTGLLWGVKSSLLGLVLSRICLKTRPDIQVVPQYNQQLFATELVCKAQIKLGYAIIAGIHLIPHIRKGHGGWRTWQQILFRPRVKNTS